ncbi:MAG: excinuclease ABC subunit UvrA [Candidatus Heimdallarchaeota archaeon]|nr:excinuclease ABC subunit UvrA [Candidatus Heimdallarchaeota archaeon]
MSESKKEFIYVQKARVHNLKDLTVKIPRNQFVVITGVSGSGKSSLAFDVIFAEGQRRYVESLSAYARQFLGRMQKPDVELIEGLSPAVSIEQKTTSKNPRSTVGTQTEIFDYLRLLFANIGIAHCTSCGKELQIQTPQSIVRTIMAWAEGTRIKVLAPVIRGKKGTHHTEWDRLKEMGYVRVRIDSEDFDLANPPTLDRYKIHSIEAIVDRLVINGSIKKRLIESIEQALDLGEGVVIIARIGRDNSDPDEDILFSENYACPDCELSFEELKPRNFSFNSPWGHCPTCQGLGTTLRMDPDLIITNPNLSFRDGGVMDKPLKPGTWRYSYYTSLAKAWNDFDINTPLKDLKPEVINRLLYGSKTEMNIVFESDRSKWESKRHQHEGIINTVWRRYQETKSDGARRYYESLMRRAPCESCKGKRLKPESLAVTIRDKNIIQISEMTVEKCRLWLGELRPQLSENEFTIAKNILREIEARLDFLISVGLPYLTLDRKSMTLSGGESQRIRLATQIGSALVGVTYVLDEPSIGLHARDQGKLLNSLRNLTDIGNTVLAVEHDHQTIFEADHIIDLGPGPGIHGGTLVIQGTSDDIMNCPNSITGSYLSGRRIIEIPKTRKTGNGKSISIIGASANNLKNINVKFPLGRFICISGVSGSGKSTLMNDTLYRGLMKYLHGSKKRVGSHEKFEGLNNVDKVINIDQSPIGRTPRSNPATYTGVWDNIRALFSQTNESKIRGYKQGRFSFNVKGGRCETCHGGGQIKIELSFLPDVWITCEDCKGKRYNSDTLEIRYKGKNIYDVLNMTVEEGLEFFENIPPIKSKLQTISDVGLGYIQIGQPATTLSGGEAQRVKLAKELSKRSTGKTIYILDEPTTGLSTHDISFLLKVLMRLVEEGNTVVVIEHNLDVLKTADWIIELGPEGGDNGGEILATGAPEEIADVDCPTGMYLRDIFHSSKSLQRSKSESNTSSVSSSSE